LDLAYIHRRDDDPQQCAVTGVASVDDRVLELCFVTSRCPSSRPGWCPPPPPDAPLRGTAFSSLPGLSNGKAVAEVRAALAKMTDLEVDYSESIDLIVVTPRG